MSQILFCLRLNDTFNLSAPFCLPEFLKNEEAAL